MNPRELVTKEYLLSLTIIHAALTVGQIFFAGVVVFLHSNGINQPDPDNFNDTLQILGLVIVPSGLILSTIIFKTLLKKANANENTQDKLNAYKSAIITQLALLEGSTLFSIVAYMLTGNYVFLGLSGIIIISFIMNRPTKNKLIRDLNL